MFWCKGRNSFIVANMRRKYVSFMKKVLPTFVGVEERIFVSTMLLVALSPDEFLTRMRKMSIEDFVAEMKVLDEHLGQSTVFREHGSHLCSNQSFRNTPYDWEKQETKQS